MLLFADAGDLLPQWANTAIAILSGPVALFGAWLFKIWRTRRNDGMKQQKQERQESREEREANERSRREDEDRAIRQWRELYRQENKRRAEEVEQHKKDLASVYEASRTEVHQIRNDLQTEVNLRAVCEARLNRLEGVAEANGWVLPKLGQESPET